MTITKAHMAGVGAAGAGVLGMLASVFDWVGQHVTVSGSTICASGMPTTVTSIVSAGLVVVGMVVALISPSITLPKGQS